MLFLTATPPRSSPVGTIVKLNSGRILCTYIMIIQTGQSNLYKGSLWSYPQTGAFRVTFLEVPCLLFIG
jgi:hypothetical protein